MNCPKHSIHAGNQGAAVVLAVAVVLASSLLESWGKLTGANTLQSANATSNASPSAATVELAASQLNTIKIEAVGIYSFPVEKEEVGSVSFDEDPGVVQAESTLLGAAGTVEVASNELVRAKALYETNGVAQRELEQAVSDDETAEAALKAARDALRALGKTDAEIDQLLADGRIGSASPAGSPVKWVLANAIESDSPLFAVGQPVKVKVAAFPDRVFDGKVSKIYSLVDPNTHRVAVRCEVDDSGNDLRPGMLASITIQVHDPVEATAIPVDGVVREGDGTLTAWVTTDSRHFTQQIIKTGMREDGEVQILDGLQRGELVATDGAIFLDNVLNANPGD